jgi:hypothetical protein
MALAGAISPIFWQATTPGIKNVFWQPNEMQQGSVAFITVELERVPLRLTGKLIDKNLAFFQSDNPKVWYALAGTDLEIQAGTYDFNRRCRHAWWTGDAVFEEDGRQRCQLWRRRSKCTGKLC